MDEEMNALRDARRTLVKTATGRIGSDELTIPRSFFDSAIRNIDAAIAAHSVIAGQIAELEGLLWEAIDDASIEPGEWYAKARALLDTALPTADDVRGILRDDAALAQHKGTDR